MTPIDRGLLDETLRFHDELVVVNGLDASGVDARLLDNMREGGVDVNLVNADNRRLLLDDADRVAAGTTVEGIERDVADGKMSLVYGVQSPDVVDDDIASVPELHFRGLRSCGLVYNVGNTIGSGCVDPSPGGLSHLGVQLVEALNASRIVVDVGGHGSEATAFDALDHSRHPVVCSHTNVRALRNTPRASTDDLIRRIAGRGGVVGITAFAFFVAEGRPTVSDYVDHIDHVVGLVGAEHVGLGFDFIFLRERTGPISSSIMFPPSAYPQTYDEWTYVDGLSNHSGAPLVTAELIRRRYTPENIARVMGLNWLRVWKEVWGR